MTITRDINYLGVFDQQIDLFEGIYMVPYGIAYNSYAIIDEKIAILDTVDKDFGSQWLEKMEVVLNGRKPDYLIIQHMEPDHSANIMEFVKRYPRAQLVATVKAFSMMKNFFGTDFSEKRILVSDGDRLSLGKHELTFIATPMVHWPEVMMTYDSTDKVFFSADAFGRFGIQEDNGMAAAESSFHTWIEEARRYYFGIVGKYGRWVQKLLEKVSELEVEKICPLHGSILSGKLTPYLKTYGMWAAYEPEEDGILIAYTSVYGNTRKAVQVLRDYFLEKGVSNVILRDLSRSDMSYVVADAFRYQKLVLATTTYNAEIFPPMREFITSLKERNFCNRKVALIENGSWAIVAAKIMKEMLERCEGLIFVEPTVRITSALNEESKAQLEKLAEELCKTSNGENMTDV